MTDVIISQSRPEVIQSSLVKWKRPINSSTLAKFASAANSIKAGRGFAHVVKVFDYSRNGPNNTVLNVYQQSPAGTTYDYDLIIPEINPIALGVSIYIVYQGVETDSAMPTCNITMTRLSDGQPIDNPVSGPAILLDRLSGTIPEGGSSTDDYTDTDSNVAAKLYYARSAFCFTDQGSVFNAGPTGPRMMYYNNNLTAGDGVKINLATSDMRILRASAFELPRLVIQAP